MYTAVPFLGNHLIHIKITTRRYVLSNRTLADGKRYVRKTIRTRRFVNILIRFILEETLKNNGCLTLLMSVCRELNTCIPIQRT
jgi:hypothetical protein